MNTKDTKLKRIILRICPDLIGNPNCQAEFIKRATQDKKVYDVFKQYMFCCCENEDVAELSSKFDLVNDELEQSLSQWLTLQDSFVNKDV